MASERPVLTGERREVTGKKVKRLRARGRIPGVVYGRGYDPELVTLPAKDFRRLYQTVGGNTLVRLTVEGGEEHNVLIHEPSRHPVTGEELHVDLYRVTMTEKITAEVPLHFTGEAPAVRTLEGTLIRSRDSVEVTCLPGDLPQVIEVPLDSLDDFEAAIHVKDLVVPANVEVLDDPDETIATVEPPRTEEELAELEETPEPEAEEDTQLASIESEEDEKGKEEEGSEAQAEPSDQS